LLQPHGGLPEEQRMYRFALAVITAMVLAGCVSFSSSNPNPPPPSTVVVPAR